MSRNRARKPTKRGNRVKTVGRIEEDLLGSRSVPLEAYWDIHTLRVIKNR